MSLLGKWISQPDYFLILWNLQVINLIKWTIFLPLWDLKERTDQFFTLSISIAKEITVELQLEAAILAWDFLKWD